MCTPLACTPAAQGHTCAWAGRSRACFEQRECYFLTSKKRRLIQPMEVVHRTRAKR